MAGINFMCDLAGDMTKKRSQYLESLDVIIHSDEYSSEVLLEDKAYILLRSFIGGLPSTCL